MNVFPLLSTRAKVAMVVGMAAVVGSAFLVGVWFVLVAIGYGAGIILGVQASVDLAVAADPLLRCSIEGKHMKAWASRQRCPVCKTKPPEYPGE